MLVTAASANVCALASGAAARLATRTNVLKLFVILMVPRLRAVNFLRDRYIWIDRCDRKIEYSRYGWQTLPALPERRRFSVRWQLTSAECPAAAINCFG